MKSFIKNIPNILTVSRFFFIPFIFGAILNYQWLTAAILLTISGLTDVLDGIIARKFNFVSNFGKLIDPLADKANQLFTLIALAYINIIPWWILIVVFSKELLMVAGASFLYGKKLVVSSRWFGKLSTVLFYLAIVSSLIIHFFNISFQFDIYIYYVALACTVLSLFMYGREFFLKGYLAKDDLTAEDTTITEKPTKEDKIEAKYNRANNKAKKLEKKKKKLEKQLKDVQ
jgi:cardiolipin synthase